MRRILGIAMGAGLALAVSAGSALAFGGCAGKTHSVQQSTPITTAQTPVPVQQPKSGG